MPLRPGVVLLALLACTMEGSARRATHFSLQRQSDSLSFVILQTDSSVDRWRLPYASFQFQTADVDNDGQDEALVGVVKTTRFDPVMDKRLFIYKNYHGLVRPLWLGSRLGRPLEDFRTVRVGTQVLVRTLEHESDGTYLVADYSWYRFGLYYERYLCRHASFEAAYHEMKNTEDFQKP